MTSMLCSLEEYCIMIATLFVRSSTIFNEDYMSGLTRGIFRHDKNFVPRLEADLTAIFCYIFC